MSGPKSDREAESSPDARWTVPPADYVKPSPATTSALESSADGEAGLRKFARYNLEKLLGQGAMGAVFLAHDPALDRKVALKIPKFSDEDEDDLRQRFYREARAAGNLRHPNICPVYDIGEYDGTLYITMAYLEGRPLSHYIDREKPLDERDAAETVIKLARALQEAHDHGVIHRDLKPDNIIIDAKGEPIIMDFGLARRVNRTDSARLTQSGMLVGSPAYMSPEQIESEEDVVGPACDIYSLGVLFYEMLTGRLPFEGSVAVVISQIVSQDPPRPTSIWNDLDWKLEVICLKMMAKKVTERYATMTQVAEALTDYLAQLDNPPIESASMAAVDGSVHQAEEQQKRVQMLLKQGHHAAALHLLAKMAAMTNPRAATYADWARQEIPRIKSELDQSGKDTQVLWKTALRFLERHEYEQGLELLQQIPDIERSDEIDKRMLETTRMVDEVHRLTSELAEAGARRNYSGLRPKIDRLLQLKPGHPTARALLERLAETGAGTETADLQRAEIDAMRQTRRWLLWSGAAIAVVLIGLMWVLVSMFLRMEPSPSRQVAVKDFYADEAVTVEVDGQPVAKEELTKRPLELAPGDHTIVVLHSGQPILSQPYHVDAGPPLLLDVTYADEMVNIAPRKPAAVDPVNPPLGTSTVAPDRSSPPQP